MEAAPALQPTNARHRVIVFAVCVSVIMYVDRVAISQAAPAISEELGLTKVQLGWAFSAFTLGYALFQIPGGWLADWKGVRRVMTAIVLWWSLFTAATGWVVNQFSLVIARFLFGVGQGGGFPTLTKAFTTWLPRQERIRAQGLMWLSARWGGAFTPLLVAALMQAISWRRAFEVFGILGVVWALFFWRWYTDRPSRHPGVNAAEMEFLRQAESTASGQSRLPWGLFVRSRTVWLLWAQYFCLSYGWMFYITWLPTYLQQARGQSFEQAALLAGMPLFFGGLGSLVAGLTLHHMERWVGDIGRARRYLSACAATVGGLLLAASVHIEEPFWAMAAMGVSSFSNDLTMPPGWGACMDVGGKYAGSLSGTMNTSGNLAAFLSPVIVGYILAWTNDNWALTFYLSAAIYLLGALSWLGIDPVTPLEPEEAA